MFFHLLISVYAASNPKHFKLEQDLNVIYTDAGLNLGRYSLINTDNARSYGHAVDLTKYHRGLGSQVFLDESVKLEVLGDDYLSVSLEGEETAIILVPDPSKCGQNEVKKEFKNGFWTIEVPDSPKLECLGFHATDAKGALIRNGTRYYNKAILMHIMKGTSPEPYREMISCMASKPFDVCFEEFDRNVVFGRRLRVKIVENSTQPMAMQEASKEDRKVEVDWMWDLTLPRDDRFTLQPSDNFVSPPKVCIYSSALTEPPMQGIVSARDNVTVMYLALSSMETLTSGSEFEVAARLQEVAMRLGGWMWARVWKVVLNHFKGEQTKISALTYAMMRQLFSQKESDKLYSLHLALTMRMAAPHLDFNVKCKLMHLIMKNLDYRFLVREWFELFGDEDSISFTSSGFSFGSGCLWRVLRGREDIKSCLEKERGNIIGSLNEMLWITGTVRKVEDGTISVDERQNLCHVITTATQFMNLNYLKDRENLWPAYLQCLKANGESFRGILGRVSSIEGIDWLPILKHLRPEYAPVEVIIPYPAIANIYELTKHWGTAPMCMKEGVTTEVTLNWSMLKSPDTPQESAKYHRIPVGAGLRSSYTTILTALGYLGFSMDLYEVKSINSLEDYEIAEVVAILNTKLDEYCRLRGMIPTRKLQPISVANS